MKLVKFMEQCTLFNFNNEGKTAGQSIAKSAITIPDRTLMPVKPTQVAAPAKSVYDTEYLCKLISKNLSIFDIRSWPRGINRKEFDALWENDFTVGDDGWWFAGHFAFAVREAKRLFRADKEKVWEEMLKYKKQQLTEWEKTYRRDADWEWQTANSSSTPEDAEHWLNCCQTNWLNLNTVLKELGKPEEPLPEKYKIAFCDPLKWGEEKKTEKIKVRKGRKCINEIV